MEINQQDGGGNERDLGKILDKRSCRWIGFRGAEGGREQDASLGVWLKQLTESSMILKEFVGASDGRGGRESQAEPVRNREKEGPIYQFSDI